MSTHIHVTIDINECGDVGYTAIWTAIQKAMDELPIDTVVRIDPVVSARATGAVVPAAHAQDAEKLAEIRDFATELRNSRIPGAVGVGAVMIASRLHEILRGEA